MIYNKVRNVLIELNVYDLADNVTSQLKMNSDFRTRKRDMADGLKTYVPFRKQPYVDYVIKLPELHLFNIIIITKWAKIRNNNVQEPLTKKRKE